jgi:hypothetical protein
MCASVPLFVPLVSIEHAEPTVYAICRPDVSGSLGVGIMLRSSHRAIRQNFQPITYEPLTNALPAFGWDEFHTSVLKGAANSYFGPA